MQEDTGLWRFALTRASLSRQVRCSISGVYSDASGWTWHACHWIQVSLPQNLIIPLRAATVDSLK